MNHKDRFFATIHHQPVDRPASWLGLRERGKPGPIGDKSTVRNENHLKVNYDNFFVAEFTYPILPKHEGEAAWFYSLP